MKSYSNRFIEETKYSNADPETTTPVVGDTGSETGSNSGRFDWGSLSSIVNTLGNTASSIWGNKQTTTIPTANQSSSGNAMPWLIGGGALVVLIVLIVALKK